MTRNILILFIFGCLAFSTAAANAPANALSPAVTFNAAQKQEIETIIQDFIAKNPELIIESLENYRKAQEQELEKQQQAQAKEVLKALSAMKPGEIGNPEGDITVVEFFDYNCGYCKKAVPELQKLLEADKNVRVLFIELPILGPSSRETAKWALAALRQGNDKYVDFHMELMKHAGRKSEETLEKVAKDTGLDIAKLKAEKDSEDIEAALNVNLSLAREIGVNGTPAFLINEEIFRGYIGYGQMRSAISKIRADNKSEQE